MKTATRKKTETKSEYNSYAPFNNPSNKPRVKGLSLIEALAEKHGDKYKQFLNKNINMELVNELLAHLEKDGKVSLNAWLNQFNGKYYINKQYPEHRKTDILLAKFISKYHSFNNVKDRKITNAKVKQSEHLIRQTIIDKILPMIAKIFLDKSTDTFNPSNINVALAHIKSKGKSKVLGNCYSKNFDVESKKTQIHINIDTVYYDEEKKKVKWSVKNFHDFLEVLVHELVHATDDCKSSHGKEFKRIATAVGLEGIGGISGKAFTSTKPNDEFDSIYKDVIKEGKKWIFSEFSWVNKTRKTKSETFKCGLCGSRFTITNKSSEHSSVQHFCNHRGTDFDGNGITEMKLYVKPEKPKHKPEKPKDK